MQITRTIINEESLTESAGVEYIYYSTRSMEWESITTLVERVSEGFCLIDNNSNYRFFSYGVGNGVVNKPAYLVFKESDGALVVKRYKVT